MCFRKHVRLGIQEGEPKPYPCNTGTLPDFQLELKYKTQVYFELSMCYTYLCSQLFGAQSNQMDSRVFILKCKYFILTLGFCFNLS